MSTGLVVLVILFGMMSVFVGNLIQDYFLTRSRIVSIQTLITFFGIVLVGSLLNMILHYCGWEGELWTKVAMDVAYDFAIGLVVWVYRKIFEPDF